jgi:hypothetical protein
MGQARLSKMGATKPIDAAGLPPLVMQTWLADMVISL